MDRATTSTVLKYPATLGCGPMLRAAQGLLDHMERCPRCRYAAEGLDLCLEAIGFRTELSVHPAPRQDLAVVIGVGYIPAELNANQGGPNA